MNKELKMKLNELKNLGIDSSTIISKIELKEMWEDTNTHILTEAEVGHGESLNKKYSHLIERYKGVKIVDEENQKKNQ